MDTNRYEHTYDTESYADGCACTSCRSLGGVANAPDERCTARRWRDSDI